MICRSARAGTYLRAGRTTAVAVALPPRSSQRASGDGESTSGARNESARRMSARGSAAAAWSGGKASGGGIGESADVPCGDGFADIPPLPLSISQRPNSISSRAPAECDRAGAIKAASLRVAQDTRCVRVLTESVQEGTQRASGDDGVELQPGPAPTPATTRPHAAALLPGVHGCGCPVTDVISVRLCPCPCGLFSRLRQFCCAIGGGGSRSQPQRKPFRSRGRGPRVAQRKRRSRRRKPICTTGL